MESSTDPNGRSNFFNLNPNSHNHKASSSTIGAGSSSLNAQSWGSARTNSSRLLLLLLKLPLARQVQIYLVRAAAFAQLVVLGGSHLGRHNYRKSQSQIRSASHWAVANGRRQVCPCRVQTMRALPRRRFRSRRWTLACGTKTLPSSPLSCRFATITFDCSRVVR